jgi:hypothetical protein
MIKMVELCKIAASQHILPGTFSSAEDRIFGIASSNHGRSGGFICVHKIKKNIK